MKSRNTLFLLLSILIVNGCAKGEKSTDGSRAAATEKSGGGNGAVDETGKEKKEPGPPIIIYEYADPNSQAISKEASNQGRFKQVRLMANKEMHWINAGGDVLKDDKLTDIIKSKQLKVRFPNGAEQLQTEMVFTLNGLETQISAEQKIYGQSTHVYGIGKGPVLTDVKGVAAFIYTRPENDLPKLCTDNWLPTDVIAVIYFNRTDALPTEPIVCERGDIEKLKMEDGKCEWVETKVAEGQLQYCYPTKK